MQFWRLCSRLALMAVLISVGAVAQQTGLIVSPSDLGLAVQTGSTTPVTGIIAIATPGQVVPFSATVRHLGNTPNWLTLTPSTGITPANLTLTADGSRLSPGTYSAQVVVAAAGLGRAVNVSLSVGATTGTVFGVSPSSLTFVSPVSATSVPTQTISITSPNVAAGFRVTPTSSGWLTVAPLTGITPAAVVVEVHPAGLPANTYSGSITITPLAGGPPTIVPVTLIASGAQIDRLRPTHVSVAINYLSNAIGLQGGDRVYVYASQPRIWTATTATPWIKLTSAFSASPSHTVSEYTYNFFEVWVDPSLVTSGRVGVVTLSSPGVPSIDIPVTIETRADVVLNARPSSVVLNEFREATVPVAISSDPTPVNFTVQATTQSGGNWLRVSPVLGSTANGPVTLAISADTSGLLPRVYNGAVVVSVVNGPSLFIPVQVEVNTVSNALTLLVRPEQLNMTGVVGSTVNPVEALSVDVIGGFAHPFTASAASTGGWLVVDPVSAEAPVRLRVTADLAKVPGPGFHNGLITLTSIITGQTFVASVNLNLLDEVITVDPPAVTLVQPRRGADAPAQTVVVNAPVPLPFNVAEKPEWVRMTQFFGTTPATIQLWSAVSVLPPGTNVGVIRIVGPKNEVSLSVTYQEAQPAVATVTPETVNLQYQVGDPKLPTQTIDIASGGEPGPFTVAVKTDSGNNWLRASPSGGTTPGKVDLSIEPLLLAPGRHTATVTIKVNNGTEQTRTVPVVLQVGAPSAVVYSVVHGATQTPTAVAPGQMITIIGTGLGPLLAITSTLR